MKFQKITGQAIRIVGYLNANGNDVVPSKKISEDLDISYQICIKISNMLKRGRIISTTRGIYGGYRLTKSISKISLFDIVSLTEGPLSIYSDLEDEPAYRSKRTGKKKRKDELFPVQAVFLKLQDSLINEMKNTSLADLWED